eukprot:TRINITY_DN2944_c0_g4_i1.p1 TRINITY_DN2944_c0_g4~~TRINITY_DN2944_c0_g4_i1.p1  ORF type:complete len:252 (-),score=52.96 TRINITY_DN2944_c0_g4_i1:168-923(-)
MSFDGEASREAEVYLTKDQLAPVEDPSMALSISIEQLASKDDWIGQFHALTMLRRLSVHHPSSLEGNLGDLMRILVANLKSLRSNLVKNALLALSDMASNLRERLPVDEAVLLVLQKVIGDKKFIRDEAIETMNSIVLNCKQSLGPIMESTLSKNAKLAASATAYLESILGHMGPEIVNSPKRDQLLSVIAKLLDGKLAEIRGKAKAILNRLVEVYGGVEDFVELLKSIRLEASTSNKLLSVFGENANAQK